MTSVAPIYTYIRGLPSSLDTHVALVEIGSEIVVLKRSRSMFGVIQIARELRLMKLLDGTNGLPRLKMHFMENHRMTLIYEYCANGDLMDYLMSLETNVDAKMLARSLLRTLQGLHARGVAHRDIKPENVVFDSDFQATIIDFGYATTDALSTLRCGTLRYSAPEILSGQGYSPIKSDIWSFGVLMIVFHYRSTPFEDGVCEYFDFQRFWATMEANHARNPLDEQAKQFIESAMQFETTRPSATELLSHAWLN